jgi:F420 biosynthesis protein FbiB-like protein
LAEGVAAAIAGRRSIRTYDDRPVAPELVDAIMAAACHAPSPHHSVPWRFAVLTTPEPKERLVAAMAERWRSDLGRDGTPPEVIEEEIRKSRRRITSAPLVIVGSLYLEPLDDYPDANRQQAEMLMAAHSLGAALQNIMLAAHAHGVASCWMCAPVFCPEVVRDALDLPSALIPHALITAGYAARPPAAPRRPSLDDIIALRA